MATTLLLIRHAVTSWHGQARVLGQHDVTLDDEGRGQARSLANALAAVPIQRLVSSPLCRAAQTAAAIAERVEVPVERDPRLTDFRVGEWEGLTYEALRLRADYRRFLDDPLGTLIPGGETVENACARAREAVEGALATNPRVLAVVTNS
ncbi:MAG TPA: histidine phosphatase family protein [Myxococcota bacterium]|nr:histidine phosphatase family protein [Myxococcota bacterium]